MKLVRSIFLALAFTFTVGAVAHAADPAADEGGAKKEKKAKKSKKAEGGEGDKKADDKAAK
jgi:hypothetical protein